MHCNTLRHTYVFRVHTPSHTYTHTHAHTFTLNHPQRAATHCYTLQHTHAPQLPLYIGCHHAHCNKLPNTHTPKLLPETGCHDNTATLYKTLKHISSPAMYRFHPTHCNILSIRTNPTTPLLCNARTILSDHVHIYVYA